MKSARGERAAQIVLALVKAVCFLVLFIGMQVLVVLPFVLAYSIQLGLENYTAAEELYQLMLDTAMLQSLVSGLLTVAVVLIFYLLRRKKLREALWLRPLPAPPLLSGAALAPALYFVVSVALALLPEAWQNSYTDAASNLDSGGIAGFIAVVLVAPVVEEFIFRGLIMTRLNRAMPGWLAIVLSAVIFGVCHGHPVWFAYAFVLGVFFGLMDLHTGSILPSTLGHMTFNLIGQIFTLLPESENGTETLIAMGVLLLAAIAFPILDRSGIPVIFRPAPKLPPQQPPAPPEDHGFDPWNS